MGIPAYYRTLCSTVPSLVLKKLPKEVVIGSLWIDFNCIIYHCIRRPGTDAYPGEEGRLTWENKLIDIICKYVKILINESKVEEGGFIYLGVDGVVPMAKMRQQRKRRFKSAWLVEHEQKLGKPADDKWDTNSITPGTAFMERLAIALKKEKRWTISCAAEPGEGEQKIFNTLRASLDNKLIKDKGIVIYGLDADLILMSLYQQVHQKEHIYLFREHSEFGGSVKYNSFTNSEEYRYLNIKELSTTLAKNQQDEASYIRDYCSTMMLLGNDFIPHGIWFTIKDGGHLILGELLTRVREKHGPLINNEVKWNQEGLNMIFQELSSMEDSRLGSWIYKKFQQNTRRSRDVEEEWEIALDEWNQTPIKEKDEIRLLSYSDESRVILSPNWRENYYSAYLGASTSQDIKSRCKSYCEGLQWALSYMTGSAEVSWSWMYPWSYPPLWEDILNYSTLNPIDAPRYENVFLKPEEQLALVLPLRSWWLLRDSVLRKLPYVVPHMWNFHLSFCTAGKRMMWECDPHIPLLTPNKLRFLQSCAIDNQIRWDKHNHKDLILRMSESIKTSYQFVTLASDSK